MTQLLHPEYKYCTVEYCTAPSEGNGLCATHVLERWAELDAQAAEDDHEKMRAR